jgi:hypothetical protein
MLGCKFEEIYRSNVSSPLLANLRLAELIKKPPTYTAGELTLEAGHTVYLWEDQE